MRLKALAVTATSLTMFASSAFCTTPVHDSLTQLAQEVINTTARQLPLQATQLGIAGHDGELDTPSEQNRAGYVRQLQEWQERLSAIAPSSKPDVSLVDRDDALLLGALFASNLNSLLVYQTDRKDYSAGANALINGLFVQFQFLPVAESRPTTGRN